MHSSCSSLINSAGLIFDIVGAITLWRYGLPEAISRDGLELVITSEVNEDEKTKAKKYDCWSKIGLLLLIAGFVLQLVSNFILC